MTSSRFRRRRVLLEGFQRRLVGVQLFWLAVLVLAFGAVLVIPDLAGTQVEMWPAQVAAANARFMPVGLWAALVGLFAATAAMVIALSHRVAGPLFRFRQVFREVAAGRLDALVEVRSHDFLRLEAGDLNVMVTSLRDRIAPARESLRQAETLVSRLANKVDRDALDVYAELAATLGHASDLLAPTPPAGDPRDLPSPSSRPPGESKRALRVVPHDTGRQAG